MINSITPLQVNVNTAITITGSGFGSDITVTVGGKTCTVIENSAQFITCQVLPQEELPVGMDDYRILALYMDISIN